MDKNNKAQQLAIATQRVLATVCGKTLEDCEDFEFFRCFSYSIRDIIMPLWRATDATYQKEDPKQLYYFSMEYLMGRALQNNILNMGMQDIVAQALEIMGRDFKSVSACEREAGLGSGGLGRLASCFLDSLATLKYPGHGYGLRYRFGIFAQEILGGYQVERADRWLSPSNPWEVRQDAEAVVVEFGGHLAITHDEKGNTKHILKHCETVRAVPFDTPIVGYCKDKTPTVNTLRLWSAEESPRNFGIIEYNQGEFQKAFKNNSITYVLYPDDRHQEGKKLRLKQQFFLVSASLQDILRNYKKEHSNFNNFPEKVAIQINDTHPTLVIPELMRILTQKEGISWNEAWTLTQRTCAYTNHTLMSEALETWDKQLFKDLLPRQFEIIDRINQLFRAEIRANFPSDESKVNRMSIIQDARVKMAHLAVVGSHSVNGVAALHSNLLKTKTLKDFADLYPKKFCNVTNGITPRRWLLKSNPSLANLISSRIGDSWITNLEELQKLKDYAGDQNFINEFKNIKLQNKKNLAAFIKEKNPVKDHKGKPLYYIDIDPNSLFDIQIKRLHEYKRQLMNVFHIIMLYHDLKDNPNMDFTPRTFIFAAKASAAYHMAKNIIKLINSLAHKINNDEDVNKKLKVVFIENYNVSKAELLFPAADLSEQISTASMEASGTGNMKFSLNGALTIGTEDGANVEMKEKIGSDNWPFTFGLTSEEVIEVHTKGTYNPREIYEKNPKIKRALDSLTNGSYADNEQDEQVFFEIFHNILDGFEGSKPDYFMVLKDLESYVATQEAASKLFQNQNEWYRLAILNMAGMGSFSTDVSINNYASKIWNITPLPIDTKLYKQMMERFSFQVIK